MRYWLQRVDEDFCRERERASRHGLPRPPNMSLAERAGWWALIACQVLFLLAAIDSALHHWMR